MKASDIKADYDQSVDVLYVIRGEPQPVEGNGLPGGVELDYAQADGRPCGITVIGYRRNRWPAKQAELARIIKVHLSVEPRGVLDAIRRATPPGHAA